MSIRLRAVMLVQCAAALVLPPPQLLGSVAAHGATELAVRVSSDLTVSILEANLSRQRGMVDEALEETASAATGADDPYGVVLWPAAQVVAAQVVAAIEAAPGPVCLLELGAGTGLCSIAAAAAGATALATDYRAEPLALLRGGAELTASRVGKESDDLALRTALFDVTSTVPLSSLTAQLGGCVIVCAADLLYMKSTSVALAARCVEALRLPNVDHIFVGDLGRPGRPAFLDELRRCGVRAESAAFETVQGWGSAGPRHELISSASRDDAQSLPPPAQVGLMRLTPADLEW